MQQNTNAYRQEAALRLASNVCGRAEQGTTLPKDASIVTDNVSQPGSISMTCEVGIYAAQHARTQRTTIATLIRMAALVVNRIFEFDSLRISTGSQSS